jgi:Domain of unknown function (DUF4430)
VSQRPLAAVLAILLALVLAACGGGNDSASNGAGEEQAPPAEASVLVTRDCGKEVVVEKAGVDAGQTAMQALQRVADVETDQGGKFVTAIEGVEQDESKMLAWLYYVNGEEAQKGAAEIKLQVGDVEWWDLHNWETTCQVPAEATG